jgi:AraC-like DNA-binding protein
VLSPLLKAILGDFAARNVTTPATEADRRLAQVLVDQLELAPCSRNYLLRQRRAVIAALLAALQTEPGSNRSLAEWAAQLHVTERTWRAAASANWACRPGEWRQRQRFLAALPMLERGDTVQAIALELGCTARPPPSSPCSAARRRHARPVPPRPALKMRRSHGLSYGDAKIQTSFQRAKGRA